MNKNTYTLLGVVVAVLVVSGVMRYQQKPVNAPIPNVTASAPAVSTTLPDKATNNVFNEVKKPAYDAPSAGQIRSQEVSVDKKPANNVKKNTLLASNNSSDVPLSSVQALDKPVVQEVPAPQPGVNEIWYSDNGYTPNLLRVKVGTTVVWENMSSRSMWTASAPHITHDGYPVKGGCIGSVFDQCQGFDKSGTWSFAFDSVGTWTYHNHLYPDHTGTIIVE